MSEKEALDTIALTVELAELLAKIFGNICQTIEKKEACVSIELLRVMLDLMQLTWQMVLSILGIIRFVEKKVSKIFIVHVFSTFASGEMIYLAIETIPDMTEATAFVELLADEFP